uniref:30S ribosomal protein S17 n=1 Tax=Nephromyces sp. ex Molgula occidentalis TaxID=2544991 RepID=A0A5C1H8A6_9APIC|nr:30S ribosomal protein S17 [Nephromyces sp. ex Molgula occidentalis]
MIFYKLGLIISKKTSKTAILKYFYNSYNKKYKCTTILSQQYWIHDLRNESWEGDWVLFKVKKYPQSKKKYYILSKIYS